YTMEGLHYAHRIGAKTVALTSNPGAPMNALADVAIVPVTGPEVLTGSTRMKAGTAQKLVLNMLSTACMVRLGRVFSNWMIGVQMNNQKLRKRAEGIVIKATGASASQAARAINNSGGSLPAALLMLVKGVSREQAARLLKHEINIAGMIYEARASAKGARKARASRSVRTT
ncbi:MAG TPA: N-acetylmuramic acid 6-phosphate etherase, partial [Terriglobia bacterium]|nr:N-acetylmuramic acid 6-phosphate etherase [Terriglobia bacterium]